MNKTFKMLLSLPKTLIFNFKYFPFIQAVKLPVLISYNTKFMGGRIVCQKCKFGVVRVGFHQVPICNDNDETKLIIKGNMIINGQVRLGNGTKIHISDKGLLTVGNNFHISGSSVVDCYKNIVIGDDVLLSYNCMIMDTDGHPIFNGEEIINKNQPISIGNHVWVGAGATIIKGTVIPDNCVIGTASLVSGNNFSPNSIIVGNPASSKKQITDWKELYPGFHKL